MWWRGHRGAVCNLGARMFISCLPMAAWETERTAAQEERETSTKLVWVFLAFPFILCSSLPPLSFLLVVCFSFPLSLIAKWGFNELFHPVSSMQREHAEKRHANTTASKVSCFSMLLLHGRCLLTQLFTLLLMYHSTFSSLWSYSTSVRETN